MKEKIRKRRRKKKISPKKNPITRSKKSFTFKRLKDKIKKIAQKRHKKGPSRYSTRPFLFFEIQNSDFRKRRLRL